MSIIRQQKIKLKTIRSHLPYVPVWFSLALRFAGCLGCHENGERGRPAPQAGIPARSGKARSREESGTGSEPPQRDPGRRRCPRASEHCAGADPVTPRHQPRPPRHPLPFPRPLPRLRAQRWSRLRREGEAAGKKGLASRVASMTGLGLSSGALSGSRDPGGGGQKEEPLKSAFSCRLGACLC